MSGPLSTLRWRTDAPTMRPAGPGDTRDAPGLGEVWTASRTYQEVDNSDWQDKVYDEAFSPLVEEINRIRAARGQARVLPPSARRLPNDRNVRELRAGGAYGAAAALREASMEESAQAILREVDRERAINPNAFKGIDTNLGRFMAPRWAAERQRRDAAGAVLGRAEGAAATVTGFAGAATKAMEDPFNLATLPIGGAGRTFAARALTDALVNMGLQGLQTPQMARNREKLGVDLTAGEALTNVLYAGAGAAAFRGVTEGTGLALRKGYEALPLEYRAAQALKEAVPASLRSPEQQAAINVLEREFEIDAASPYVRTHEGLDAHAARLRAALDDLVALPEPRSVRRPVAPRAESGGAQGAADGMGRGGDEALAMDSFMRRVRGAESSGNDNATPGTSSAYGRYQFIERTWLTYYKRRFGEQGLSDREILAKRGDGALQDVLMRDLTANNARFLRSRGFAVTEGNLYLTHFAGEGGAAKVLGAAPDMPVEALLSPKAIAANSFLRGKTAGELIAWAERKMGGSGAGEALAVNVPEPDSAPHIRPDALDAVRPLVITEGREVPIARFRPDEIGVDAELMQFKSGGDEFGVTDRLRGVERWDPMSAGVVTVWEALDGRRLIADGHQRLGLARRIGALDPTQEIQINALVLREIDGVTAQMARSLTALKNIREGSGSAIDAAKVFRDVGLDPELLKTLPPRSALIRDGKSLSRLSYEAFGAAVNEVIPESHAAVIGELADDPASHMALVELLKATDPANRRQAESIVRQALGDGFHAETQEELFGTRSLVSALYAHKARAIDRTLSELRRLKGAFGTAARNSEALDAAGNRIDVGASEAAAQANARALALVEKLANTKGNEVSEIFTSAARRIAEGEPLARVVRDVVGELQSIDLERAVRDLAGDGGPAGGSGRGGDLDGEAGAVRGAAEGLDGSEGLDPSPATLDELEAAGQGGFAFADEAAHTAFDDPAGPGVVAAADSAWHDLRAGDDPNIAARRRQELDLAAQQPLTGGRKTGTAQAETLPEGLFGGPEEPRLIDLDDGKGPRAIADIDAELTAIEQGLDAMRGCLK